MSEDKIYDYLTELVDDLSKDKIYDYLTELVDDYIASFDEDINEACKEWDKDKVLSCFIEFIDTELLFSRHCKKKKDSNPKN